MQANVECTALVGGGGGGGVGGGLGEVYSSQQLPALLVWSTTDIEAQVKTASSGTKHKGKCNCTEQIVRWTERNWSYVCLCTY